MQDEMINFCCYNSPSPMKEHRWFQTQQQPFAQGSPSHLLCLAGNLQTHLQSFQLFLLLADFLCQLFLLFLI